MSHTHFHPDPSKLKTEVETPATEVHVSCGNVFEDLGFPKEKAEFLLAEADAQIAAERAGIPAHETGTIFAAEVPHPVLDTSNDKPIEAMADNFEEMALEDEDVPLLTPQQEGELTEAILNDVETERVQNAAHYGSLADAVPVDDIPQSPHQLFGDPYADLDTPMPMTDSNGIPIDQGRRAGGPPILGTQADRDAVDMFIRGEIRTLTLMQKNLLIFKLQQEGTLESAIKGQSASPALNTFFNDLRRMQKRNPVVFGRQVKIKQRTSKSRDKGKKKRK